MNVVRLETLGGSWQRKPTWTIASAPSEGVPLATVWVGEGPYDGLLLVAESTFRDGIVSLEGHIIESDLPSVPATSAGLGAAPLRHGCASRNRGTLWL